MTNIYVFGSGDCGQLGLGEDVDLKRRPFLHPFFADKNIVSVCAGGLHSLALSSSGEVYSWGCNDEKALGHKCPDFTVGKVEGLDGVVVVQVAAGDSISAALSTDGKVYTWGTFRDSRGVMGFDAKGKMIQDTPTLIDSLKQYRIIQIAAGSNHLVAITDKGQLYSWGCGEQGQLGRRVLERHRQKLGLRPSPVTPRSGRTKVKVKRVACGSYHTLAISEAGELYTMGLNNFGQLGLGDHEERLNAALVHPEGSWANNATVVDASAGEHHSMILLSNGQVYTFGRADMGQLGVHTTERAIPQPVHVQPLHNVKLIASGGNHNIAVSGDNQALSWGFGEMYQLGHGKGEDEQLPKVIEAPLNGSIVQVSAGGQHSILLTE